MLTNKKAPTEFLNFDRGLFSAYHLTFNAIKGLKVSMFVILLTYSKCFYWYSSCL